MLFAEFSFYSMTLPMPASPLMYGIMELHDHIFFFLNMMLFMVLFLLATTVNYFNYLENSKLNKYLLSESVKNSYDWMRLKHGSTLEMVWTVMPSMMLVFMAMPSFALLYATDELVDPAMTMHVMGHQWYWSYEYNDLVVMDLQSYYLEYEDFCDMHNSMQFLMAVLDGYVDLDTYVTMHKTGMYTLFGVTHDEWGVYLKSNYVHVVLQDLYEEYLESMFHFENSNLLLMSADKSYDEMDSVPFFPGMFSNHFSTPNSWLSILSAPIISDINFTSFAESLEWGITGKDPVIAEYIHGSFEFDSYLKSEDDLKLGEQRLYETDFPLVLPKNTHMSFMMTSDDVIHSWSVPALGMKVDAVPGRMNHAHTYMKRSGIFYGQCSELCGVNHAFMPMQIMVFEPNMYYNYLRLVMLSK